MSTEDFPGNRDEHAFQILIIQNILTIHKNAKRRINDFPFGDEYINLPFVRVFLPNKCKKLTYRRGCCQSRERKIYWAKEEISGDYLLFGGAVRLSDHLFSLKEFPLCMDRILPWKKPQGDEANFYASLIGIPSLRVRLNVENRATVLMLFADVVLVMIFNFSGGPILVEHTGLPRETFKLYK